MIFSGQLPGTGAESRRIAACGDCAHSLWAAGNADGAIRIEQLWDHIATIYGVDILCGYELSSFHGEEDQDAFQSICAEHRRPVPRERN